MQSYSALLIQNSILLLFIFNQFDRVLTINIPIKRYISFKKLSKLDLRL